MVNKPTSNYVELLFSSYENDLIQIAEGPFDEYPRPSGFVFSSGFECGPIIFSPSKTLHFLSKDIRNYIIDLWKIHKNNPNMTRIFKIFAWLCIGPRTNRSILWDKYIYGDAVPTQLYHDDCAPGTMVVDCPTVVVPGGQTTGNNGNVTPSNPRARKTAPPAPNHRTGTSAAPPAPGNQPAAPAATRKCGHFWNTHPNTIGCSKKNCTFLHEGNTLGKDDTTATVNVKNKNGTMVDVRRSNSTGKQWKTY